MPECSMQCNNTRVQKFVMTDEHVHNQLGIGHIWTLYGFTCDSARPGMEEPAPTMAGVPPKDPRSKANILSRLLFW